MSFARREVVVTPRTLPRNEGGLWLDALLKFLQIPAMLGILSFQRGEKVSGNGTYALRLANAALKPLVERCEAECSGKGEGSA